VTDSRDATLMGPWRGADSVDFDAVYQSQWWPMLRVALALVDDVASAEDVTQDAFAALYKKLESLRDPQAANAYLRTCVVNGARSALRRRRTARSHLKGLSREDHEPSADAAALHDDEQRAVRRVLGSLPQRQREVLTLRLIGDLDDREIAAATGMSHGNVRSAASRGLATLRATIGDQL
jgi:RNA polymerase sigma-70 factor (sigma-E family)